MLTARIAGTTAAFIVIVASADIAAAQTVTTTTPTTTTTTVTATAETASKHEPTSPHRAILSSLYGSYIALQGFDVESTLKGVRSGRTQEANPIVGSMAESPAMLLAFKAGTT